MTENNVNESSGVRHELVIPVSSKRAAESAVQTLSQLGLDETAIKIREVRND